MAFHLRVVQTEPHLGSYIRHLGETYRPDLTTVFPDDTRVQVETPEYSSTTITVSGLDGKIQEIWIRAEPSPFVNDGIPDSD